MRYINLIFPTLHTKNINNIEHMKNIIGNQRETQNISCHLSIVVPMYNEEESCQKFFDHILPIISDITESFEIICVNDGSNDTTLTYLKIARAREERIKIVNLTRNFGKDIAMTAGIDHASGDAVIPLDADLQDPPALIPELVAKWREGYDMVIAVRHDRRSDTIFKRITADFFYRIIGRLSDVPIPAHAGDFRLMDRRVIEALQRVPERTRFMKGLFAWLGFKQAFITYARPPRVAGVSKWKIWKLWNFALEGIISFTTLPLRMWTYVGLIIAFTAISYLLFIVGRTLLLGIDVPGYASLVSMLLFFSGIQMIGLGIIGEYLGRVFIEVKQRPLYLVQDTHGFDPPSTSGKRL